MVSSTKEAHRETQILEVVDGASRCGCGWRGGPGRAEKVKSSSRALWGSDDPIQASFGFHHARAFAAAGHEVQIFLLGEAVTLMRTPVANSVIPVGWPPLSEAFLAHQVLRIDRLVQFARWRLSWNTNTALDDLVSSRL
jgi:hypothetical protein